jgi:hypothetical protein
MPAVPITSPEQYERAIEVLTRVGGTWQGVGQEERFLLVSEAQYGALVEARVISSEAPNKGSKRGQSSRKAAQP